MVTRKAFKWNGVLELQEVAVRVVVNQHYFLQVPPENSEVFVEDFPIPGDSDGSAAVLVESTAEVLASVSPTSFDLIQNPVGILLLGSCKTHELELLAQGF